MDIKNTKAVKIGAFVLAVLIPAAVLAAGAFTNTNLVPNLEIVYKNSVEAVSKARENCIQTEIALAKAKLANHYSGVQKTDNLEALADKAEGKGLTCSNL